MDEDVLLINKIKQGDDDAFKEILNKYHNMIYKIINTTIYSQGDFPVDEDSLYQEGSLALYNSVLTYEKNRGASFSSFAYMNIRSRILAYYTRKCKYYHHESVSLDNSNKTGYSLKTACLCISEDPIAYHKEQEFAEFLNNYISNLSSMDRQIIELKQNNYSYKQISKCLNISEKKVDNRLRLMKRNIIKQYQSN